MKSIITLLLTFSLIFVQIFSLKTKYVYILWNRIDAVSYKIPIQILEFRAIIWKMEKIRQQMKKEYLKGLISIDFPSGKDFKLPSRNEQYLQRIYE